MDPAGRTCACTGGFSALRKPSSTNSMGRSYNGLLLLAELTDFPQKQRIFPKAGPHQCAPFPTHAAGLLLHDQNSSRAAQKAPPDYRSTKMTLRRNTSETS